MHRSPEGTYHPNIELGGSDGSSLYHGERDAIKEEGELNLPLKNGTVGRLQEEVTHFFLRRWHKEQGGVCSYAPKTLTHVYVVCS